jgi:hypothetical protein
MERASKHIKSILEREIPASGASNDTERPQKKARYTPNSAAHFDPTALGLSQDFALTNFSALKGCGCKLPQKKLLGYLEDLSNDLRPNETPGMDSSCVKINHGTDLYLISTTDYFFPSVEDPYVQVGGTLLLIQHSPIEMWAYRVKLHVQMFCRMLMRWV